MTVYVIAGLAAYLVLSFLFTALYVRFAAESKLTKFFRKNFYSFPFFPILFLVKMVGAIISPIFTVLPKLIRTIFEKISGKRTYRRGSNYYKY